MLLENMAIQLNFEELESITFGRLHDHVGWPLTTYVATKGRVKAGY